jgi:glutamate dehydrogenase/leucine dehydrogenase
VAICADLAANELGLKSARVVVQGFGQVGSIAAQSLYKKKYKVIAVSDVNGAVTNPDGLNIDALMEHVKETGGVPGFVGGKELKSPVLELDCDILIPAAVQDVITEGNAGRIRATLVVEAANAPISPEADNILLAAKKTIVPDVVANCGGVVVCDFERTQGLSNDYWPLSVVKEKLKARMVKAYSEARDLSKELRVTMRQAAWGMALKKIRSAILWRGWN